MITDTIIENKDFLAFTLQDQQMSLEIYGEKLVVKSIDIVHTQELLARLVEKILLLLILPLIQKKLLPRLSEVHSNSKVKNVLLHHESIFQNLLRMKLSDVLSLI